MRATSHQCFHVREMMRELDLPTDRVTAEHASYFEHVGLAPILGQRMVQALAAATHEQLEQLSSALIDPEVVL